jgi:hypothetical protein
VGAQNRVTTCSGGRCLARTAWVRRSMYPATSLCSALGVKGGGGEAGVCSSESGGQQGSKQRGPGGGG